MPLIDMLKEAALRAGMLAQFTPVGTREAIERDALWERLLLVAFAYGTNTGIGAVAQGDHGHSESDIRYAARRYFTLEGARAVAVELANATFAARGFAITSLLDFDLLPRIKRINNIKLYDPDQEAFPRLVPAMTRAIRWDLIEQN